MVQLAELVAYSDALLEAARFKDYCPNGLQIEGRPQVNRIISGVTASAALLDAAMEDGADLVLVHHGYFWRGEDPCITGLKAERLRRLIKSDISLLAYHLPLDAHPVYGNNAQLAQCLEFEVEGHFGPDNGGETGIGWVGRLAHTMSAAELRAHIADRLQREPLHIAGGEEPLQRIAWCTGAAQGLIEQALALGVDAFLSGEASEQTVHVAREGGIHYFGAGHHATERYGAKALGEHLAERFGVTHHFIDVPNPV
jgi:dinuclear metal center YbgI/SA1388 family protein